MASTADTVRILYHRPPDRDDVFVQRLVHRDDACVVTFMARTPVKTPARVDGRLILENGSPVVWFTFPGAWHDVGRFHTVDGRFTGTYSNILTPVEWLDESTWRTTDLFLDVWIAADGDIHVLDQKELEDALAGGAIDAALARRARAEASRLQQLAAEGTWPPSIVDDWPLARVLAFLESDRAPRY